MFAFVIAFLIPCMLWHDSFPFVTWLVPMCDMTHSHVWHDSFPCVAWLIPMCDMTHSHVWHDSFPCVTWLISMCDMTHSHVWHDSFPCVTWLIFMTPWYMIQILEFNGVFEFVNSVYSDITCTMCASDIRNVYIEYTEYMPMTRPWHWSSMACLSSWTMYIPTSLAQCAQVTSAMYI